MDPRIIKKTQDTLGKVIKKPPLTDKLLGKPPFRFLHDIMTSVMKQTGLMKGLFAEQELNSENVKDKDSKIAFLQKSIDFISFVNGKSLGAKPSKIVAGHEPEKTNEFLQAIAAAINAKVDNDECVNRFLNKGSSKEKEKPKEKDDRRKREKDTEEKRDRQKSRDRDREKSRDRERSRDREKEERHDREKTKDQERDRDERHRDRDERHRDREERHKDRKKKVVSNDPDTLAEFLCADDNGTEDNTDTDMEMIADLSEMDSPIQRPDTLPRRRSETKRELSRRMPRQNKGMKEAAEPSKAPRASRPGAARPTENRRPDQSYSNNEIDKQATAQRSEQTLDNEHMSEQFVAVKGKKRKSGTKSRMSVRPKEDMEPVVSLHSDQLISQSSGSTSILKYDTQSPARDSPGKSKKKYSQESLQQDEKLNKTASEKVLRSKLKNIAPFPGGSSKSSPSKSKRHQVPGPLRAAHSSRRSSDVEHREKIHRQESIEKTQKPKLQHRDEEDGKENETMVNGEKTDGSESKIARPSSAKGSRRRREGRHQGSSDEEDEIQQTRPVQPTQQPSVGEEDLPPQVAASRKLSRPSSARPAPPRRKQETIENEPAMRLGSGKPANVIVDADKDSDDDDDNFVVEESAPPPPEPEQTVKPEDSDEEDHGGLVKKILETKKELEGGNQPQQAKRTEVERPTMSDAQRRKQREQAQKEIDKLRGSIQTLTRSANPLGKIMDYVQEDLDSMQKELDRWKSENKEHTLALKRERGITDKAIEPLKAQLSEVDQAIKDQLDLIAAVKSNIIRNDQKIEKMLRSIAKS